MGGGLIIDPRGIADRRIGNRIATPNAPSRLPEPYPPFSVVLLGSTDQSWIPTALAYGLIWQIELDRLGADRPEEQQDLAAKLLAIFDYLIIMQVTVERDARDDALLYRDPMQMLRSTHFFNARIQEISDGTAIPVADATSDPLPAWAPSVFPREFAPADRTRYPSRPRSLATIPPFDSLRRVQIWLRMRNWKPQPGASLGGAATSPARAGSLVVVSDSPPPKPVDVGALDAALDQAAAKYKTDSRTITYRYSPTPLVDGVIDELSKYTLVDLRAATGADVRSPYEDDKLIEHTEVILYHSVFTVVLDRRGNPFDLRVDDDRSGMLEYGMLLPPPGSQMMRALPQPRGINISVQHAGDTTFRIEQNEISKVLFGGVGSFAEYGYGNTSKHEVQVTLESFLLNRGLAYIASVSAEAAFRPAEMTVSRIYLRLCDLAEAATPYVTNEIGARAQKMFSNWGEYATQALEGAIKQIIFDAVKDRIKDYLIKKIGKRVVPVVNAAFALYDLVSSDQENIHLRYAMACAWLAIKGTSAEDTELAAKIVSKICADEFEQKVIQKLVEHAVKNHKKLIVRSAKEGPTSKPPNTAKPAEKPLHAEANTQNPATSTPIVKESVADKNGQREAEDYVREKVQEAMKVSRLDPAEQKPAAKHEMKKPDASNAKAIGARGAVAKGTDGKGTDKKGTEDTEAKKARRAKEAAETKDWWAKKRAKDKEIKDEWQRQQGKKPRKPRDPQPLPQEPRPDVPGTLEKPRRLPAGPKPPPGPMQVKEPPIPEGTDAVGTTTKPRTSGRSGERILRNEDEKARGAFPIDHDAHHVARKAGGRAVGQEIRDLLGAEGVSVNELANSVAARGLPRDPGSPHASSSQHWNQHNEQAQLDLLQELRGLRGDPDGMRAALARRADGIYEGERIEPLELIMGPGPDEPSPPDDDHR